MNYKMQNNKNIIGDVMKLADYIIDVGPDSGTRGGNIVFKGTPKEMLEPGNTITSEYLRKSLLE